MSFAHPPLVTPVTPELLVSVRDVQEAWIADSAGAGIIDIKEPLRGSLGMANTDVVESITRLIRSFHRPPQLQQHPPGPLLERAALQTSPDRPAAQPAAGESFSQATCDTSVAAQDPGSASRGTRVQGRLFSTACPSAALGEVLDWETSEPPLLHADLNYVKLGLSGLNGGDWEKRWLAVRARWNDRLPLSSPAWIAVAYVDVEHAQSPPVSEIVRAAGRTGCAGVLLDTWSKRGGHLLDYCPPAELASLLNLAKRLKLKTAVAGSLRLEHLPRLVRLPIDIIAVRGAVCQHVDRTSTLCHQTIQRFQAAIHRIFRENLPINM